MNFHPPYPHTSDMPESLFSLLGQLRDADLFDVRQYVESKSRVLNEYFRASKLTSAVVAVSGGVDSAVVAALVHAASRVPGSPVKRIVPVLLPVHDAQAATNQDVATARGLELCEGLGLSPVLVDLTPAHQTVQALVDRAMRDSGQAWAKGQLVAYQRTPALYYVTSLLTQQGTPGVLVGTTNYDEGAYLGYFGKASDGLVDLQLISDLHKSEVYAVAQHLNVPDSILSAVPTGDMYDGRVDEEVFGASYDFVELFLRAKRNPVEVARQVQLLDSHARERFAELSSSLEDLHRYNSHKYLGRSPAVHLDVLTRWFPSSWNYANWSSEAA